MSCPDKYLNTRIEVTSKVKIHEYFVNNCINKWSFKDFLRSHVALENISLKDAKTKKQEYIRSLRSLEKKNDLDADLVSYINTLITTKHSDVELKEILDELAEGPKISIVDSIITGSNVIAAEGSSCVNTYGAKVAKDRKKQKRKLDEEQDGNKSTIPLTQTSLLTFHIWAVENVVSVTQNKKTYGFIKPVTPNVQYNINSPSFASSDKKMIDLVAYIKLNDNSFCENDEVLNEYTSNMKEQGRAHYMAQLPVALKFLEDAFDQPLDQMLFWMCGNGFDVSQPEEGKKAVLFIRLVLTDFYANCIKPSTNNPLNERTPFVEYVVPVFKYFSATYKTIAFQWCEKGLETNKYISLYHENTVGRRRLADSIGYATSNYSEAVLMESSGEENEEHVKEDTMKLLECSIRALKMEMETFKLASLTTFKRRRFYTMLYSKDKLTMMSTSFVDPDHWAFIFVREATLARAWSNRHSWLSVFELALCLNDKLKQQQDVSLLLLKEQNGWVEVEDGSAISHV